MKKIMCKIRNIEIDETEEEKVRQRFIDTVKDVYGYQYTNMKVEYGVKRSPSDNQRSIPVDIAIFEDGVAKIFVETKAPGEDETDGVAQLKDYMSFDPDVHWGIWTDGDKKLYIEKIYADKVFFKEAFNIPSKGFSSVSEEIKKKDLKTGIDLKSVFKNIRAYVAANAIGITRDETVAREIMKIVLCKTYDEKFKGDNQFLDFHSYNDDSELTFKKINELYEEVKTKYFEVFDEFDSIKLDEKSLLYTVNQLQRIYLTQSNRNVISDAFETILGETLKGEQAQFFTPKNVVKLVVNVINPTKNDKIIDPAAGSGGFLIESMLYVWNDIASSNMSDLAILEDQKDFAMKKIFGIEKDDFLAQLCKSYMAIIGDGKSGIYVEDSLEYPNNWKNNTIQLKSFDLLLTNPPFGKKLKVSANLARQYTSNKIDTSFLERSLNLLRDGGKMGIVLSEVIFHAPSYKKYRELMYEHNITDVIDLPHDTFRPYNNAKCIVILLEKNKPQQNQIRMIKINEIGHTPQGDIKYVYDYEKHEYTSEVADDVPTIIDQINSNTTDTSFIKMVNSKKVIDEDILVPRYYFMDESFPDDIPFITMKELVDEGVISATEGNGSPAAIYKGMGNIPYVRVKDIVNNEVYINPQDKIPLEVADNMRNDNFEYKESDIIFVRRGSYRIGDVGQLHEKDLDSIYTKELQFFSVDDDNKYNLTNHNLFAILTSKLIKKQLSHLIFLDTTLPTIYKRWEKLRIPLYDEKKMKYLDVEIRKAFSLRKNYWKIFSSINI